MIRRPWRQRSIALMLSTAISGVRRRRAKAAETGSKSVITTSGSHSSTSSAQTRIPSGSSSRALRTFWTTVCQRRIWPSSMAKVGPKTWSTSGRRSLRWRKAAPEAKTLTWCRSSKEPITTSERVACPIPSPLTP